MHKELLLGHYMVIIRPNKNIFVVPVILPILLILLIIAYEKDEFCHFSLGNV